VIPLFVGGKKDGNELISPFAYLASNMFEAHIVAELEQSFLPCDRVEIPESSSVPSMSKIAAFGKTKSSMIRLARASASTSGFTSDGLGRAASWIGEASATCLRSSPFYSNEQ
jgi:hypothetical protein